VTLLLAGDIGGTKTLLSLHRCDSDDRLEAVAEERYPSAAWEGLAAMVGHFLAAHGEGGRPACPAAACFAVAGPVNAGTVRLTNLAWGELREGELREACGIERLELVNDFAVLVHGIPHLRQPQQALVRDGDFQTEAPVLILGAGTGLGVAIGIPAGEGLLAMASEAGHASFAPRTPEEWELREWLQADLRLERVSIERVVSGTGLGQVARWLLASRHPEGDHPLAETAARWRADDGAAAAAGRGDLPAAVATAAAAGDPLACEALDLWLGAYGAVTGDLALATLSRGGIWLAGGTAAKLLPALRSRRFETAFLDKGRLREVVERMPITAVLDPAIGSFSAAWRARSLLP
jgi:glucokinase